MHPKSTAPLGELLVSIVRGARVSRGVVAPELLFSYSRADSQNV